MRKQITNKELDRLIQEVVSKEIGAANTYQLPEGRDLSIELKSLRTRAKFIDFSKVEPGSAISSVEFKKLLVNADKYNELFEKIKLAVCGKVKQLQNVEFALTTNCFQLSNDDEQIFLLFEKVFKDFADEDESNASFEADVALGDNLDFISSEINEKINKFGMSVNLQLKQQFLIVTLKTPFNFAEYNKEIDKHMR